MRGAKTLTALRVWQVLQAKPNFGTHARLLPALATTARAEGNARGALARV